MKVTNNQVANYFLITNYQEIPLYPNGHRRDTNKFQYSITNNQTKQSFRILWLFEFSYWLLFDYCNLYLDYYNILGKFYIILCLIFTGI